MKDVRPILKSQFVRMLYGSAIVILKSQFVRMLYGSAIVMALFIASQHAFYYLGLAEFGAGVGMCIFFGGIYVVSRIR